MEFCASRKTPQAIAASRQLLTPYVGMKDAVYKHGVCACANSILKPRSGLRPLPDGVLSTAFAPKPENRALKSKYNTPLSKDIALLSKDIALLSKDIALLSKDIALLS
jgi:hypothetical protein